MEYKLLQEKYLFLGQTLFQVFLDLMKAYDTLDHDCTLAILEGYGVGPNIRRLLRLFWCKLRLCPRQRGYYGKRFIDSQRGVTQGGITSPTIFNIVMDTLAREWELSFPDLIQASYADDGHLAGVDPIRLQAGLDFMTELFARVRMKMNATKTKAMICHSSTLGFCWSTPAYKCRLDGVRESSAQAKCRKVACPNCDAELQERSFACHILTWHGQPFRPAKHHRLLEKAERPPRMYHASLHATDTPWIVL